MSSSLTLELPQIPQPQPETMRLSAAHIGVCLKVLIFGTSLELPIVAPEVIEQSGATTASDIWYVNSFLDESWVTNPM